MLNESHGVTYQYLPAVQCLQLTILETTLAFIGEKPKAPLVVIKNQTRQFTEKDVDKYKAMTPLQERMNAIAYCHTSQEPLIATFLFLLSGA
jgi:hypothetical protein